MVSISGVCKREFHWPVLLQKCMFLFISGVPLGSVKYLLCSWVDPVSATEPAKVHHQLNIAIPDHKFLFPEYEIVREPEETESPDINEKEQEDLEKNEESTHADETSDSLDVNFLEAMAKHETQDDKIFQKFKERISLEPEQVIRYCRDGGGPIWISGENIPQEADIPNCSCGGKRIFEFQVMPQLLSHLKVDSLAESIDWGTLAIYTCDKNCNLGSHYTEEFIWKQDISSSV